MVLWIILSDHISWVDLSMKILQYYIRAVRWNLAGSGVRADNSCINVHWNFRTFLLYMWYDHERSYIMRYLITNVSVTKPKYWATFALVSTLALWFVRSCMAVDVFVHTWQFDVSITSEWQYDFEWRCDMLVYWNVS